MSTLTLPKILNGKHKKMEDYHYSAIYETYDYGKFKILDANREINPANYRGLVESVKEEYLLGIIIVNEKYEIIDGQHRFTVAKELGLPVRYTIAPGYGMKEVRRYNSTMKKWVKLDYRDSYAAEGKDSYIELIDFMRQFPKFGIQVSIKLLTGTWSKNKKENGKTITLKTFQEGGLRLDNVAKAYVIARKIMDFEDYYHGFNSPTFIGALLPILNKKCYDHKRMIQKLNSSPIHLEKQGTQEQYRLLLQKIYNYKTTPENRVDFFNV